MLRGFVTPSDGERSEPSVLARLRASLVSGIAQMSLHGVLPLSEADAVVHEIIHRRRPPIVDDKSPANGTQATTRVGREM
jgi:hypothetical protein